VNKGKKKGQAANPWGGADTWPTHWRRLCQEVAKKWCNFRPAPSLETAYQKRAEAPSKTLALLRPDSEKILWH
jgi:hypothetical protein